MPAQVDCIEDPAIPAFMAVLDPAQLGEHLRQIWPLPTNLGGKIAVRLLRHHAGKRCVVEITLREPSLRLIGKVYAKDRSDVYKLMREISSIGFGPSEPFSIPQPIAYLRPLHLLLQERVEGRPATASFLSDDESERRLAAERCAQWLARFHAMAPGIGPSFHLSTYLGSLQQWCGRLASLGEPFTEKAGTLFKQLRGAASTLQRTEPRTIHGDFTHHQILFLQRRTVTVDWDNCALADSARDLARFVVGLKRLALRSLGSIHALDDSTQVFLKTYMAAHGAGEPGQLVFHMAAICLEHAKHDIHKRAEGWRQRAEATLDEGLRVLGVGA